MLLRLLSFDALTSLCNDGRLLFGTRFLRMFAYGFLTVVLLLYLSALGFSQVQCGLLFTLTLLGDTAMSLLLTTTADRFGKRYMLILGAALMVLSGVGFVLTQNFILLTIAATIGVISPSGNEVGPFLALEQAALAHLVPQKKRVSVFAWYNLAGFVATAIGALAAGSACTVLQHRGTSIIDSYRIVLLAYAAIGAMLAILFAMLSANVELQPERAPAQVKPEKSQKLFLGLHRSRHRVLSLSALFSLDAFAGGFVIQTILAYWFHVKFGASEAVIGSILFGANLLAGLSTLAAPKLVTRFGLLPSMILTHAPANLLLILVPLMPTLPLAIAVLLLRFAISKMDVPTRQCFTLELVDADERSAAAGVTGVARTLGAGISPVFAGALLGSAGLLAAPFFVAGTLELVYDLLLWKNFSKVSLTAQLPVENRKLPDALANKSPAPTRTNAPMQVLNPRMAILTPRSRAS